MTKIKTEIPVISKDDEEWIRSRYNGDRLTDLGILHCLGKSYHYNNQSVSKQLNMYKAIILGEWELEKNLFYIKLNPKSVMFRKNNSYLNFCKEDDCYYTNNKENYGDIKTQFTQEEVDEFLQDEPKDMWVVEEVED